MSDAANNDPTPGAASSTELAVPAARVTAVDDDGYIFDVNTGEVLGRVDVKDEIKERFEVDSLDAAEWVLELRSKLEGDIAGIEARINALLARLGDLRSEKIRRLSWWEYRFGPSLTAFARKQLKGKARTAKFVWGKVSFRVTRGNNAIIDNQAAVEYVRVWAPERIKVKESVNVGDVLAARELAAQVADEDPTQSLPFLVSSGPGESVSIDTGIDIQAKVVPVPAREDSRDE